MSIVEQEDGSFTWKGTVTIAPYLPSGETATLELVPQGFEPVGVLAADAFDHGSTDLGPAWTTTGGSAVWTDKVDVPDDLRCPHCDRDRHQEPLTAAVAKMWGNHKFDPQYRAEDDTSVIVCVGSDTYGPARYTPKKHGYGQTGTLLSGLISSTYTYVMEATSVLLGVEWPKWEIPDFNWHQWIGEEPEPICTEPPEGLKVEFGPEQWIHEFKYIPQSQQFVMPSQMTNPVTKAVAHYWEEFTTPDFPVPESPGYNFTKFDHEISYPTTSKKGHK